MNKIPRDDKKYIYVDGNATQVNNPTQNNYYGDPENSVKTIGRTIKDSLKDEHSLMDKIVSGVNTFWSLIIRWIWILFKVSIAPFVACAYLLFLILHLLNHPNPSIINFTKDFVWICYTLVTVNIPEFLGIVAPIIVVYGIGILFIALVTISISNFLYKDDKTRRKTFFRASFLTQLFLFLRKRK